MSGRKKIYQALLEGASEGLTDNALYDFVVRQHPKATSKKIVRASLLALSDPMSATATSSGHLCARHPPPLDPVTADDGDDDDDDDDKPAKGKSGKPPARRATASSP